MNMNNWLKAYNLYIMYGLSGKSSDYSISEKQTINCVLPYELFIKLP